MSRGAEAPLDSDSRGSGIVARRARFFHSLNGVLKKRQQCEVGAGPCMAHLPRGLTCISYVPSTNVCPCDTLYNNGTADQGQPACCGSDCPTERILPGDW